MAIFAKWWKAGGEEHKFCRIMMKARRIARSGVSVDTSARMDGAYTAPTAESQAVRASTPIVTHHGTTLKRRPVEPNSCPTHL